MGSNKMNEQLQVMLDKLKERIEYFGFVYDPCKTMEYVDSNVKSYTLVTFYHPEKLLLSGSFSITISDDVVRCVLLPFNIEGSFKHCYDALWLGLKLWKVYAVDTSMSDVDTTGGEGE